MPLLANPGDTTPEMHYGVDGAILRSSTSIVVSGASGDIPLSRTVSISIPEEPSSKAQIVLQIPPDSWPPAAEKEFFSLAKRSALCQLTSKEEVRFQKLTESRRQLHHARSGEEVLLEYQQRKAIDELFAALQQYAHFYNITNPAWTSAEENVYK